MGFLNQMQSFATMHCSFLEIFSLILVTLLGLGVYRLYFHPLARFPGPTFAILTYWYEFYFDALKRGQYIFEIKRMHEKYGPIVRINPNEIHVNDPDFIDKLYTGGTKRRDKYAFSTGQFGIPESVFATNDHDHHRLRRGALNPFFSKASITKLEPAISGIVQKLCQKIEQHAGSGDPITLSSAFSCMTTDIVSEYAFAKSTNYLSTDSPRFETNLSEAILEGTELGVFMKHFPWLFAVVRALPDWLLTTINPTMKSYLRFQNSLKTQIADVQQDMAKSSKSEKTGTTIFHELLLNKNLPDREKTVARLWQEGQIIVGAGTETTAWGITVTIYYLLQNPTVLAKLLKELKAAIPDPSNPPALTALEQLPYLIMISEGLRLSYGVSTRSQRILPHESLTFKYQPQSNSDSSHSPNNAWDKSVEYEIPPGTPIGMTSVLIHHNTTLFPDSDSFIPDRFIDSQGKRRKDLEGCLLSFSKGSRQCVGINLAYAEMYMAIASVIRTFGDRMKLFETTDEDVLMKHDVFVPMPKAGSKGVRVLVN